MLTLTLVALGSALGGMARFGLSGWIARTAGTAFPWGTLAINLSGSLVIGAFFGATGSGPLLLAAPAWHQAVTYGFLGGYTTYSTFSLEVLGLWREALGRAALYVGATIVLGVAACVAGFFLAGGAL